jgi:hypothetical protein
MGWYYVSELWPPTGLSFFPRVICEHWEPWWWWWRWCRLEITPDSSTRALWQSYQQRYMRQVGGMDEGVRILPISIWNTSRDIWHAVKFYDMGLPALHPIQSKLWCGFLSPCKENARKQIASVNFRMGTRGNAKKGKTQREMDRWSKTEHGKPWTDRRRY